jgi:hypothetical protein
VTTRLLEYRVGNENNPGDPWGRSELVIHADGAARLDHHFSRGRGTAAWTGYVDAAALDALWNALEQAGFPAEPASTFVAGATLRVLTVKADGRSQGCMLDWHKTASMPGYAEAFDILDGVVRQLSGDAVPYPTRQSTIVREVREVK